MIRSHEKLASPTLFREAAVTSSKSAFLDAYEEPPWCVRERLVVQYEREKPRWGNNYHRANYMAEITIPNIEQNVRGRSSRCSKTKDGLGILCLGF